MESPPTYPESLLDQDDVPYACMACGEILEEGKAFELSGQRWHIDCFRCSTCNTLLDSDAHLLLLGDGSLICSNCTYSCNSCGNKIEDLAILTGDQAFCAQCFRCRNCKKKIENLRYARTSQGIFCMDCHESLMQRRRKKKSAAKKPGGPGFKLDKSLPSLPNMDEVQSLEDLPIDTYMEATTDSLQGKLDGAGVPDQTETTGKETMNCSNPLNLGLIEFPLFLDGLILPSSTYRSSRHLGSQRENDTDGGELLIPLTFDPSENQRTSPRVAPPPTQETSRDYFNQARSGDPSHGPETTSGSSMETTSPHIAYQEKGWERTDADVPRRDLEGTNGSAAKSSITNSINRPEHTASARSSRSDLPLSLRETSAFSGATSPESKRSKEDAIRPTLDTTMSTRPSNELRRLHEYGSTDSSHSQPSIMAYPPRRSDSLNTKLHEIPRKNVEASPSSSVYGSPTLPDISAEILKRNFSPANPSLPVTQRKDSAGSSSLPQGRFNGSDSSQDEDIARFIGVDESLNGQSNDGFLRRVSNSVRHGRSYSDKSVRLGKDGKFQKSPTNGSSEIGSPTISTSQNEEISWLRNELQKERQRVSEMEAALRATADVKKVSTELSEKRSTMVVLDAQREMVLRELTVLTEHLEAEKRGAIGGPLDLGKLSNHVLRELAESIQKLKESYSPQIEALIQKRNDLSEELVDINNQKDKAFQEFEQVSSKNAQLAELNNQLVHQIQELYKVNSDQRSANGLGIVSSHSKDKSVNSLDSFKTTMNDLTPSLSTAHISEGEPATATIMPGPQVVNIRKGQPRKFNWKKGGQNVAKGVKGLKGAFMSSDAVGPEPVGGLPRSQTQDPSRQGFGFFGNQKSKQGGKMSQADSVPVLTEAAGALFGVELEVRMEHEKSIIPAIVTRCIQEVELRGMDMEGIYRKSGAASAIQGIKEGFERSPFDYDISDPDLDIHAVTSTLKQYFRKLPNPLITYEVYENVIDSGDYPETAARIEVLQKGLSELPRVHLDVLEFLVFHLKRVVERQSENLMTSQNVAVVFAPTIMRPESLAREMTDVQKKNDVLKFLVENCNDVFNGMQG
ncbi:hypothetical protein N7495_005703 [Penicillium taxi]|uniref:uncharacterized protein n=1 Tax=Penicillium taxi TaxID=168475 RepID=UPI00254561A0|nr:uncharacterized protein N7495_005703 [Penicillium taxi]KAJ5894012.1 hypothetical protein N7495_005703 [Penicillium taxi]